MVFRGKIDAERRAYIKFLREDGGLTVRQICEKCGVSRATVYRFLKGRKTIGVKKSPGRPKKLCARDERLIEVNIKRLRVNEGTFSLKTLRAECSLHHVSLHTLNRCLKRMRYKFCEARRKGVLSVKDCSARVKFARQVLKRYPAELWTRDVCFYLDGVSFWHKTNPVMQAKTPQGKIWRRRNEGLSLGCVAKGAHTGSGGRVLRMFVAISYRKGVVFCSEYDKCDGDYFANFICREFPKMFRRSAKSHSKLFVQDNCPIQNCAKARRALASVKAKLFAIPPRSCDINPIENVFNLVKRELQRQAIKNNITYETYEQFTERVKCTLYAMSSDTIDNIISSMNKHLRLIIGNNGKRTKY